MKTLLSAFVVVLLTACTTTPIPGPDIAPICRDGWVNGLSGCYAPGS